MRQFIRNIFIYCISLATSAVIIAFCTSYFFEDLNVNYLASFKDKVSSLKEGIGQRRIVFIGGSNLTFGLNSETLASEHQVSVSNLSLHAGIGLNNEFDLFMQFLDSTKDIILISPEFETLSTFDENYESEESVYCKSLLPGNYPSALTYVGWIQRNNPIQYLWDLKNNPKEKIAHRDNFNRYGDIDNLPPLKTTFNFPTKRIRFNDNLSNALNFIKDRMKGYNYFILSPVINPCWSGDDLQEFDSLMRKEFGARYVLPTDEMHFDKVAFYDTHYHLNEKGRADRTQRFSRLIDRILKENR